MKKTKNSVEMKKDQKTKVVMIDLVSAILAIVVLLPVLYLTAIIFPLLPLVILAISAKYINRAVGKKVLNLYNDKQLVMLSDTLFFTFFIGGTLGIFAIVLFQLLLSFLNTKFV